MKIKLLLFARLFVTLVLATAAIFPVIACNAEEFEFSGQKPPDSAQYFDPAFVTNRNHVYSRNIQSVRLFKAGLELSDAIISLGSDDQLKLEFDDLEGSFRQYYYTFEHCDAHWNKSAIWPNEYLEGFTDDLIEGYEPSFNTYQVYTHYEFKFPNERIKFLLSGNYLVMVYSVNPDGSHNTLITRRFMVVDNRISVQTAVTRARDAEQYESKQEVSVKINKNGYRIDSPYQDIQIIILQNGRWDNALTSLKPFMVLGDVIDYSHYDGSNYFDGGNEFRYVDITSLRSVSEKVKEIRMTDSGYQVRLWENAKRTFRVYEHYSDIDGKFLLRTVDEESVTTMGEYAWVYFFLAYDAPVMDGSVYIAGNFNGWDYTPENKMRYNFRKKGYDIYLYLKQGYYNYQYALLPGNSVAADLCFFEGNHSETGNTYTILVYHRQRGTVYDQLIAVKNVDLKGEK